MKYKIPSKKSYLILYHEIPWAAFVVRVKQIQGSGYSFPVDFFFVINTTCNETSVN